MANPVVPELASPEAVRLWQEIALRFREACLLRRQGRLAAAATILEQELPPTIREWFAECGCPADEAKARLSSLFNDEQARIESHWIIARFLADRRDPGLHRQPPAAIGSAVARLRTVQPGRIPVGDVTAMIDAARDCTRHAAPAWA